MKDVESSMISNEQTKNGDCSFQALDDVFQRIPYIQIILKRKQQCSYAFPFLTIPTVLVFRFLTEIL